MAALRRGIQTWRKRCRMPSMPRHGHIKTIVETYLREGVWSLDFYGEDEEKPIYWATLTPAYDSDGNRK